jgi:hypothetical protein
MHVKQVVLIDISKSELFGKACNQAPCLSRYSRVDCRRIMTLSSANTRKPGKRSSDALQIATRSQLRHNTVLKAASTKTKARDVAQTSHSLVASRFLFAEKLLRGTVLSRPNRFTMEVDVDGIGVSLRTV